MTSEISYSTIESNGVQYNVRTEEFRDRCDECEGKGHVSFSTDADHEEYERKIDECTCCCGCDCVELEKSGLEACKRCGGTGEDKGNYGVVMTYWANFPYASVDFDRIDDILL